MVIPMNPPQLKILCFSFSYKGFPPKSRQIFTFSTTNHPARRQGARRRGPRFGSRPAGAGARPLWSPREPQRQFGKIGKSPGLGHANTVEIVFQCFLRTLGIIIMQKNTAISGYRWISDIGYKEMGHMVLGLVLGRLAGCK